MRTSCLGASTAAIVLMALAFVSLLMVAAVAPRPTPAPACITGDAALMQAIGALTREKQLNDRVLQPGDENPHLTGSPEYLASLSAHYQVLLNHFATEAKACLAEP